VVVVDVLRAEEALQAHAVCNIARACQRVRVRGTPVLVFEEAESAVLAQAALLRVCGPGQQTQCHDGAEGPAHWPAVIRSEIHSAIFFSGALFNDLLRVFKNRT